MLFITFLQDVFRTLASEQVGVGNNGEYLTDHYFGDDISFARHLAGRNPQHDNSLDKDNRIVGLKILRRKLK